VQEEPDRLPAIELAQGLTERDQMVVVHPDEILGQQHRRQSLGEIAVDPHVAGKVAPRKPDQRRPVMKQRPQHAIGVADVVFVVIAPRQIEEGGGDIAVGRQLWRAARPLADRTAVAEPDPAVALQRGAQSRRQPALARLVAPDRSDPVGDDNQAARRRRGRYPGRRDCGRPGIRFVNRHVGFLYRHSQPSLATCG
jgi:hypothetical protein